MNELADRLFGTPGSHANDVSSAKVDTHEDIARGFELRLANSSTLTFRVAYSVLRHRQDAEDVAQEAFVRAHREFRQLRDRSRFRAWLARMTWRLALDHRRGHKRRAAREDRVAVPDISPSHETELLATERSKRLWAAIDQLPERLRLVVVLASIEEYSVKDVAAMVGSPEGTVKSRLFAARVRQGIEADADAHRTGWLSGWRWLVPAAAAAVIVVAAFLMSRPGAETPRQVVARAPVETSNPLAATPEAVISSPATASTRLRSSSFGGQARAPENLRTREPELDVLTNQPAILRALWAGVDSTAALVESVAKTSPDTVPEIVVNPIEVSPIVIKWLGDPQTAPGAPIIRRVTADMAERRDK